MFKDLPEGQTHSYNDGCGEPAHNFAIGDYAKLVDGEWKHATVKDCTHVWNGGEFLVEEPDTIAVPVSWLKELVRLTEEHMDHEGYDCYFIYYCAKHIDLIREKIVK